MAEENMRPDTGQDQSKAVEDAIRAAEAEAAAASAAGAVNEDAEAAAAASNEQNGTEAEAPAENGEREEKKGFFAKKKDKEKEALKEQVAELDDRLKRQMAEFENFRKRTDKEKEQMFSMGERSVLEKFLPVIDNFERGFGTVSEEDQDDAFVVGMRKVYDQLMKEMGTIGVTPIDAAGKDFDPDLHNAVMQVDSEELESGKVAQELQKGYMYHDTVLRHSMVSVVR